MSLENFKNIVDRKGYLVEEDDRQVFESSIVKSNFELNRDDFLEFIMYDISDNQIPQGKSEELVRYIPLTDENIRNYFITTNTNLTKKPNEAQEFIVDVERLVKEAGYKNGRFKTQVAIVNRRAGFEVGDENKLWIQEISPSRTEIRIVPNQRRGVINPDLEERYSIFTRDSQFRDDTIYKAKEIVDRLDVEEIFSRFLTIKGNIQSGESYIRLIQKEFGIPSFDEFVNKLKETLVESFYYFVENREWRIDQSNYGQPLSTPPSPELSIDQMRQVLDTAFILIVNKFLPKRDLQDETGLTPEELKTLDEAKQVLRTLQSNQTIGTSDIAYKSSKVFGCTDSNALNYNPSATTDDGSCRYRVEEPPIRTQVPPPIVQPPIIPDPPVLPPVDPPIVNPPIIVNPIVQPPIIVDPIVDPPVQPPVDPPKKSCIRYRIDNFDIRNDLQLTYRDCDGRQKRLFARPDSGTQTICAQPGTIENIDGSSKYNLEEEGKCGNFKEDKPSGLGSTRGSGGGGGGNISSTRDGDNERLRNELGINRSNVPRPPDDILRVR